ncbi:hypothetical protein ADUPG1_012184 [Aduncisulcus paluster]|uniref:Integrase catalytic domain-containing protein n=1 Tax=Aduncisulcus paluster TaxID=2918883 RepID=A0ABQ5JYL0_9EUKA|nr:hypothetical protein ADUPG1_012184 [Aduncisulcus paluster]
MLEPCLATIQFKTASAASFPVVDSAGYNSTNFEKLSIIAIIYFTGFSSSHVIVHVSLLTLRSSVLVRVYGYAKVLSLDALRKSMHRMSYEDACVILSTVYKVLSEREQRWTINEKEAYAVKHCVEKCEHYLRGIEFLLQTDHANLLWMAKAKSKKVQRWWTYLVEFKFVIEHIKGSKNAVADALSRVIDLKKLIVDSSDLKLKIKDSQKKNFTDNEKETFDLLEDTYVDKHERMVIPKQDRDLKKLVFERFHSCVVGHHGAMLTQFKIQEAEITWSSIAEDIRKWIKGCPTCQKIKAAPRKKPSKFRCSLEEPFHTICVDSIGPLPQANDGSAHLIVMVDRFTRWVEIAPVTSTKSEEAARVIMERIVSRYGVPKNIISDGGPQYANYLMDHMWDTFGSKHHVTSPGHSNSNGAVERVNREVKRHLLALLHDILEQPDWHVAIPIIQIIINNTRHTATRFTPSEMLFGKRDVSPLARDWTTERKESKAQLPPQHISVDSYVKKLTDNIRDIHDQARQYERTEEERPKSSIITPGTYVLIKRYPEPKKLQFPWEGPYVIVGKTADSSIITPGTYVLIKRYPEPKKLQFPWEGPYVIVGKTADVEYRVKSLLGAVRYVHEADIKVLGGEMDLDKAIASLVQDTGRRLPKQIIKKKGRGRGEMYEVVWYGFPEGKTTWAKRGEIEGSLAFKEFISPKQ